MRTGRNKRFFCFALTVLAVLLMAAVPAAAEGQNLGRVADIYGLYSEDEVSRLNGLIDKAVETTGVDFAVVTTDTLNGLSEMDFADAFYDAYGLGAGAETGGTILIIAMKSRDVIVLGHGSVESYFTYEATEEILDKIAPHLTNREYVKGAETFLREAKQLVLKNENRWLARLDPIYILMCIGVGLGAGIIVVAVMLIMHHGTVNTRSKGTGIYINSSKVAQTHSADVFTGTHTRRRALPQDSDSGGSGGGSSSQISGSSSSGRSYSGGSRKF